MIKRSIRRVTGDWRGRDELPRVDEGRMIEAVGMPLEEEEVV